MNLMQHIIALFFFNFFFNQINFMQDSHHMPAGGSDGSDFHVWGMILLVYILPSADEVRVCWHDWLFLARCLFLYKRASST